MGRGGEDTPPLYLGVFYLYGEFSKAFSGKTEHGRVWKMVEIVIICDKLSGSISFVVNLYKNLENKVRGRGE